MNHAFPLGALGLAILASCAVDPVAEAPPTLYEVGRDDLRITVREQGEIRAAQSLRLSSRVEGLSRLLFLIPEGTIVDQDTIVAELDASGFEERRAAQAIAVAKAEAALQQTRMSFEIIETDLEAARSAAAGVLEMATLSRETFAPSATTGNESTVGTHAEVVGKLRELLESEWARNAAAEVRYADLESALMELLADGAGLDTVAGEMANRVSRQISEVDLAATRLGQVSDALFYAVQRHEAQAVSRAELEAAEITHKTQLAATEAAWSELRMLIKFRLKEEHAALLHDIRNAELQLESVLATNEATRVRQQADLVSKEAEYELARQRLVHWNQQIQAAVIRAPAPGLVVYANVGPGRGRKPVQEGMEIHQGQPLIHLPDVIHMVAELNVPEAQIGRVAQGQRASVTVDAFRDREFAGEVIRVSTVQDSGAKTYGRYATTVRLDDENHDGALRPGMNATIEVLIDVRENVITVPLEALRGDHESRHVWKATPNGPEAVDVTIGADDGSLVEVTAGLREGDRVYLDTPAGGAGS